MAGYEEGRLNGRGGLWIVGSIGGSTMIALGTLLFNVMSGIANNAQVAIDVAAQHGTEMNIIRGEIQALREEMLSRTDDRFKGSDAERYQQYYDRRIEQLEKRVERLE